jgi:ArsR family transcriptional regulator, arsenate/arsenite/antimonite-responsive transcriptional repressor
VAARTHAKTAIPEQRPWTHQYGDDMNDSTSIELFRALGDPVRLAIVNELRRGTRCACVLAEVAAVSPSLLSHHLKTLQAVGLISGARRGRWIDYTLDSERLGRLADHLAPETLVV